MLLMATVDDVPAEVVPYIIERVMEAGADNIHVVNAITKKNRMEYIVYVDVREEKMEAVCTSSPSSSAPSESRRSSPAT